MRVIRNAVAVLATAVPLASSADCLASGCYTVYVDLLQITSGGAWLGTSGTETLANCSPDSGILFKLDQSNLRFKEIYATLLAAQLADKLVSVDIIQGTSPCTISYVTLNRQ